MPKTYLHIDGKQTALEDHLSPARTLITLGRNSDEAYNVIALDDDSLDVFQCQFSCTPAGWKIHNGQWRTECPKGIRSRLQHACNCCMGCCVNVRPARPTYSWRLPTQATRLNGTPLTTEGTPLHDGDEIAAGTRCIRVVSGEEREGKSEATSKT